MKLPITIAMFTSAKGHFGGDTYKHTLEGLRDKKILDFCDKVAHIKWQKEEGAKLAEMSEAFKAFNFEVIDSEGQWRHYDKSHYSEHARDIHTLMQSKQVQQNPFVLWIEDDVLINSSYFYTEIQTAMDFLNKNPEVMCVRILDRADILPSMKPVEDTSKEIFLHQDCFSFRANIMRSRDVWTLGSFFSQDFGKYPGMHIERFATEVLRKISGAQTPFACFSLEKVSHEHIGSKEFVENILKIKKNNE